ncbi:MAG: hypothetical protein A2351_03900 [Omnitrophica bacterium RIFOXYB12_FULL_50_7]|nr:MAG: hypothetical protein A2351_03900 [Omnitrophica bacterium RIFOXYB12_FULL_50_7]
MKRILTLCNRVGCVIVVVCFFTGCATNLTKPSSSPRPSKVKFGEFSNVEVKAVGISESFASSGANQKALKKIDELVFRDLRMVFPNMKRIESGSDFPKAEGRTLQITPLVKEIKFIGGNARFWVGAMAGSSAVLMQTTYRDSSTGEVIAEPEFYRAAGAYSGALSIGSTDNNMLDQIAQDVVNYTTLNR